MGRGRQYRGGPVEAGGLALEAGHRLLDHVELEARCQRSGVGHDDFFAALVALRDQDAVNMRHVEPSRVALLQLTPAGLGRFLAMTRPDLDQVRARLRRLAAEAPPGVSTALAADVGESPLLVEFLLDEMARQGLVVASRIGRHRFRVHRVAPG